MLCYAYDSKCWTFSSQMRMRPEATQTCFHRRMMRRPWAEDKCNEKILRKIGNERTLILTIRKRKYIFFGAVDAKRCLVKFNSHIEMRKRETASRLINEFV